MWAKSFEGSVNWIALMEDILLCLWNIKKQIVYCLSNTTTFLYLDTATYLMTEIYSYLQIEKCRHVWRIVNDVLLNVDWIGCIRIW